MCKKSPWFFPKNRTFYHVCFSGKPGKKRSLFNTLDKKIILFRSEKGSFKKSPKLDFSKGVRLCSCQNIELFTMWVFLGKLTQKRLFFNIKNKKEYFLEQKSEVSNRSKRSNFSKGLVLFFGQKIKLFTMRVLRQTMEEKIDF